MDHFESYSGRRVLLTGSGYVAAAIARLLSAVDCEIVVLHRPSARAMPRSTGRASIIDAPHGYMDANAWRDAINGVSVIFHLAAQTGARLAEADRIADFEASAAPLALMLDACRAIESHPIIVFASSVTVMGSPDHLPANEATPPRPFGIYEIHKLLGEAYLADAVAKSQVRGTALRLPNVYGPGPISSSGERGVLGRVVRSAMQSGEINIYGNGAMLRDYLFIDDVAAAFLAVAPHIDSIRHPAYVLAGDKPQSLADAFGKAASAVKQMTGRDVAVSHLPLPAGTQPVDMRSYFGDASAFRAATGWQPEIDFHEGMRRTVAAIQREGEAQSWPQ